MRIAYVKKRVAVTTTTTRDAQHLTLATHGGAVPALGSSIIASATDVSNGIRLVFQNPAAGEQLPHNGMAVWPRGHVFGQDGVEISPWYPALDIPAMLVTERVAPSVDPGLIRVGMIFANFSDPSSASCTEGWGVAMDYSGAGLVKAVGLRCSAAGTWVSVTSATATAAALGASFSAAQGSLTNLRNLTVMGTDPFGDPIQPQGSNIAIFPAADAVAGANQTFTNGSGFITWYSMIVAGWMAAGGTGGVSCTFDPRYWIQQRPGRA